MADGASSKDDTRNGLIGCTVLLAIIFGIVWSCSGSEEAKSLSDVNENIVSVRSTGPGVEVLAQLGLLTDGNIGMTQIGSLVGDVAAGIQKGLPDGAGPNTEWVKIRLNLDATDRLGRDTVIDFGTMTISIADISQAKLDNLPGTGALELVGDYSPSAGAEIAIKYCSDRENFLSNPHFCRLLAKQ